MDKHCDGLVLSRLSGAPMTEHEDKAGMEDRMDTIRLKQILGASLTEQELMCLQIEQHGFGCSACSSPDGVK